MEIVYEEAGEKRGEIKTPPFKRLFNGLTGLFGLLAALLCGMNLGGADKSCADRLHVSGRSAAGYTLTGAAVVFFVTGVYVSGTILTGEWLYPGIAAGLGSGLLTGWSFAFVMAGLAVLLANAAKADGAGIIALIFIAACLLGGTAFDIREVWAAAAFARFLFPNYYFAERQTGALLVIGITVMAILMLPHARNYFLYVFSRRRR
jgi:hypothetical protein